MRKISLFIHSTFNGVVTGDPREDKTNFMAWTTNNSLEVGSDALLEAMENVDTILLGRGTYEDLSRKWPIMPAISDIPLGKKINSAHKIVVTGDRPLDELKWGDYETPEQLTGDNVVNQIKDLKMTDGGDIIIFGSPVLVRSLTEADLIDKYIIQVHTVVTNDGERLFDTLSEQKDFRLIEAKALDDTSLLVTFEPVKA
ncbi:MAG TPA: dihydrofolate reductase family protein [Verrucomicrobiae bacterium]|nr:dihydrofolate reductase family protein [Verrucomicrobiae bacterium]